MPEPIKILVVDDSAIVRKVFKEQLSRQKDLVVVGTAPDPYVARDKIVKLKPDVLTLDIEMPRMTGFELTEKIRSDPDLASTPLILCSSLASQEDRERGIKVGANAYIIKGEFDQTNLLEVIDRLI